VCSFSRGFTDHFANVNRAFMDQCGFKLPL
jgi:hypothetical protein